MIRQLPTLRTNSVPIALTTTLGMQTSHSGTGWPIAFLAILRRLVKILPP